MSSIRPPRQSSKASGKANRPTAAARRRHSAHAGSGSAWVVARAPNLKAVVFECERNALEVCLPGRTGPPGLHPEASELAVSHLNLQSVVVRMLFDPAFCDAVYADPVAAVADPSLPPADLEWLRAPDRRAWATDPHFRGRHLHGLATEYPTAIAVVARRTAKTDPLLAFFGSGALHDCIRRGGSLALSFGRWLTGATGDPWTRGLVTIELLLARLRRPEPPSGAVGLGPGVGLVTTPVGALDLYRCVLERLSAAPDLATAALDPSVSTGALPAPGGVSESEWVLATKSPRGGFGLEVFPDALAEILRLAEQGEPRSTLESRLRALGADPGEDAQLVDGLLDDGLLRLG